MDGVAIHVAATERTGIMGNRTKATPVNLLQNKEAEMAVLGRLIVDSNLWHDASQRLTTNSFTVPMHITIYRGIDRLMKKGIFVSKALLIGEIGDHEADGISLSTYISSLVALAQESGVAKAPIGEIVAAVASLSARRDMARAGEQITERALSAPLSVPVEELRAEAQHLVSANDGYVVSEAKTLVEVVGSVISKAQAATKNGKTQGIRSGLKTFDQLAGAMLPGQLIVIAGETSSGKTALVMQIGHMVAQQGHHVRISSLEMSEEELGIRYLTKFSGISSDRIIDAKLTEDDFDRLMGCDFSSVPLSVDDQPRQTVGMIQARVARSQAVKNTRLTIIDHLQYVKSDLGRGEEREQVRQVVDDVKAMAKRLMLPVILVSHITRPAEYRQVSRASDIRLPSLNSLYGSSAIEKAADVVVFVHRPSWYLGRSTPLPQYKAEYDSDLWRWKGKAELVLAKRRMGLGFSKIELEFDEATTWFTDADFMMEGVGL